MTVNNSKNSPSKQRFWLAFFAGLVALFLFIPISRLVLLPPAIDEAEAVKAANRIKVVRDLNEQNHEKLTTYAWVDQAKGLVRIPIDRAMELTILILNANKPHSLVPVSTPSATTPIPAEGSEVKSTEQTAPATQPSTSTESTPSATPVPAATPSSSGDSKASESTPSTSPGASILTYSLRV